MERPQHGHYCNRTIEDLEGMVLYAKTKKRCAVIGEGRLGLEAAKGMGTHVLELAPYLMPTKLEEGGGNILQEQIIELGIVVRTGVRMACIQTEQGIMKGVRMTDSEMPEESLVDLDMLVVSAGARARDELARECGIAIGTRGGVAEDSRMRSIDPDVYAIGEVACYGGMCYGLIAPGWDQASVLANNLEDATWGCKGDAGSQFEDSTAQKLGRTSRLQSDPSSGLYRKLIFDEKTQKLIGGLLVGNAADYFSLLGLPRQDDPGKDDPGKKQPHDLFMGGSGGDQDVDDLCDDAIVCLCQKVTKKDIVDAVKHQDCCTIPDIKHTTTAGSGCGGCILDTGSFHQLCGVPCVSHSDNRSSSGRSEPAARPGLGSCLGNPPRSGGPGTRPPGGRMAGKCGIGRNPDAHAANVLHRTIGLRNVWKKLLLQEKETAASRERGIDGKGKGATRPVGRTVCSEERGMLLQTHSSPMGGSASELGAQGPVGFCDLLGLSADGGLATFTRRRESEIKHGRISMLATMGYIMPELTGNFPGHISPSAELQYADIPNGFGAISKFPALGWGQIVLNCAACEAAGANHGGEVPGDFWWKVLASDDPEQKQEKRAAELANGRSVMMATFGRFFQDGLIGSAWGDWANYADSPLRAVDLSAELGTCPPLGFWDPLDLSKLEDPDVAAFHFKRRRVIELQHGRASMLARTGYIAPEYFRWPGFLSLSEELTSQERKGKSLLAETSNGRLAALGLPDLGRLDLLRDGGIPRYTTWQTIYVRSDTGKTHTVQIHRGMSTFQLKQELQARTLLTTGQQRLVLTGKQLMDNYLLTDYNIQPGTTIELVSRLRGGHGRCGTGACCSRTCSGRGWSGGPPVHDMP